jgi:hypothetical protein
MWREEKGGRNNYCTKVVRFFLLHFHIVQGTSDKQLPCLSSASGKEDHKKPQPKIPTCWQAWQLKDYAFQRLRQTNKCRRVLSF